MSDSVAIDRPALVELTVRTAEVPLPPGSAADLARRFGSLRPVMLSEGLPLDGRRCCLISAGAVLRFTALGSAAGAFWEDGSPAPLPPGADPLGRLTALCRSVRFSGPAVPAAVTGFLGFMAYDAVRCFERLPQTGAKAAELPDYSFFLAKVSVIVSDGTALVVAIAPDGAEAAEATLQQALALLNEPQAGPPAAEPVRLEHVRPSFTPEAYAHAVRRAKEYIGNGDIFQVVLSVRLDLPYRDDPFRIYRQLAARNPSPFQYCYVDHEFAVVGASPEPLVTAQNRRCTVRPLAGTRRRGATPEEDLALEAELRSSEKELAEHRMLLDLARNDLGRVCATGTVTVDQMMTVERYSHVMHLVSNVVGTLAPGKGIDDLLRSCFPAGPMSGAPKVRAMEIIDELEPVARGLYSGGVGLITADDLYLFITIRSMILRDGWASLQAGAGIVYDSDPMAEYWECRAKLKAALAALGLEWEGAS